MLDRGPLVSPPAARADRLSGQIVRKVTMCLPQLTVQSILRALYPKHCRATAAGTGCVFSRSPDTGGIFGNVSALARVLRHRFIVTLRISPYRRGAEAVLQPGTFEHAYEDDIT